VNNNNKAIKAAQASINRANRGRSVGGPAEAIYSINSRGQFVSKTKTKTKTKARTRVIPAIVPITFFALGAGNRLADVLGAGFIMPAGGVHVYMNGDFLTEADALTSPQDLSFQSVDRDIDPSPVIYMTKEAIGAIFLPGGFYESDILGELPAAFVMLSVRDAVTGTRIDRVLDFHPVAVQQNNDGAGQNNHGAGQ
jgi:hypothetical protein